MTPFKEFAALSRERVDTTLDTWLSERTVAPRLQAAMRYSVFNGGKRIRPVLTFASAQAVDGGAISSNSKLRADTAAAAVECIHAYSLIHDDLPAMDDDDLRRGKPTCHIEFDEATAILAGDALQTLAFEKLAGCDCEPQLANTMVLNLAVASGDKGMVAGQMIDMLAEGQSCAIELDQLKSIHRHKTGALIKSAVVMGGLAAGANDDQLHALERYADAIGLAFQVQDDIIDVTSSTEQLGKAQGADIAHGKSTYVSLLGLEKAKQVAHDLLDEATQALNHFGEQAQPLHWIAQYIVERDR